MRTRVIAAVVGIAGAGALGPRPRSPATPTPSSRPRSPVAPRSPPTGRRASSATRTARASAYVFGIDGDPTTLCYVLEVDKIAETDQAPGNGRAAHIHLGAKGTNGPVEVNLAWPQDGQAADCLTEGEAGKGLDPGEVQRILANPRRTTSTSTTPSSPAAPSAASSTATPTTDPACTTRRPVGVETRHPPGGVVRGVPRVFPFEMRTPSSRRHDGLIAGREADAYTAAARRPTRGENVMNLPRKAWAVTGALGALAVAGSVATAGVAAANQGEKRAAVVTTTSAADPSLVAGSDNARSAATASPAATAKATPAASTAATAADTTATSGTTATAATPATAATAVTPASPTTAATPASAPTANTAASPVSPKTAASPVSPVSPKTAATPASPASPVSAPSAG